MIAPAPKLAAWLEVLSRATLIARSLGFDGQVNGLSAEKSEQLGALMDAMHNIPHYVQQWEICDETQLLAELGHYDARWNGHLVETYERVLAERSAE